MALILTILSICASWTFGQIAIHDTQKVSLESLFDRASEDNESIRALEMRLKADSLRVQSARGGLLPQIDANAEATLLDIVPSNKLSYIGDGPLDILLTGGVSQKIWDGGRTRAEIISQKAGIDVSIANLDVLRQSVRLRIAESYYRLIGLQRELDVINENLSMLDERIRFVGLLISAGRSSETDRGRFEVVKSQLEGKRLQTEFAYESTCRNISALIGLDNPVFFVPTETLELTSEAENFDIDIKLSPVVARQNAAITLAGAELRKAKTALMPSINARAWYGWEFADAGFSFSENERWFGGVFASVPIFHGLSTRKKIEASRVAQNIAQVDLERTVRETDVALRNAIHQMEVLRHRYNIEENAATQAEENLRLGLIEYEAGRRSNMDIIDMQNSLLQTQLSANSMLVEYYISKARLASLAGNL
jgi:outer membrane protein